MMMLFAAVHESVVGTKRTYRDGPATSAVRGRTDLAQTQPEV
jgi:hypothetical protein